LGYFFAFAISFLGLLFQQHRAEIIFWKYFLIITLRYMHLGMTNPSKMLKLIARLGVH